MALIAVTLDLSATRYNPFKPGSVKVEIGGLRKTLTRSTSCKIFNRNDNIYSEERCICCLLKHGIRRKSYVIDGKKALAHCQKKYRCPDVIYKQMAYDVGMVSSDNNGIIFPNFNHDALLKILVKKHIIQKSKKKKGGWFKRFKGLFRKKEKPTPTPRLTRDKFDRYRQEHKRALKKLESRPSLQETAIKINYVVDSLTPQNVREFLGEAGLINKRLIREPGLMKIQKMAIKGMEKYAVYYRGREMLAVAFMPAKNAEEAFGEHQMLRHSTAFSFINKSHVSSFPTFVLTENVYEFRNTKGEPIYALIYHTPKGKNLSNITQVWSESPELQENFNKERERAFTAFGQALANFHKQTVQGTGCILKKGGSDVNACKVAAVVNVNPAHITYDNSRNKITFLAPNMLARTIHQKLPLITDMQAFREAGNKMYKGRSLAAFQKYYVVAARAYARTLTRNKRIQSALMAALNAIY